MNEGKRFEIAFKNSVPKNVFYFRIPDPAESFSSIREGLRFTLKNPCDIFLFNPDTKTMYALELKSTKDTSLTFWREDFEDKSKKQTFMVRKNQIEGLQKISNYPIVAGFIFNFRFTNHTYFQSIDDFINMTKGSTKKSFNEADVYKNNGVRIGQEKMKVNFKYDVETFLQQIYI